MRNPLSHLQWRSLHVHHHDDIDPLLRDGVRPLFHRLRGHVESEHFVRHWRRGPHVRINLRCEDAAFAGIVRPLVDEVVGGLLARTEPRVRLVPEEHLDLHRRLALLEVESGPLLPWRPDRSIHEQPFDRRRHVWDTDDAADLAASFYAGTNDLVFDQLDRVASGERRLAIAFDLMVATAHGLSGLPLTESFVSFRSHAEGFLHTPMSAPGQRDGWEAHYRRHAAALTARVRALVTVLDDEERDGTVPRARSAAGRWVAVMQPHRARAARLVVGRRVSLEPRIPEESRTLYPDRESIPFHQRLVASPGWPRFRDSSGFALFRLMMNYTYLHLSRLGVAPEERFLLCHLVANAVEGAYGVSAEDVVEQPRRRVPSLPAEARA